MRLTDKALLLALVILAATTFAAAQDHAGSADAPKPHATGHDEKVQRLRVADTMIAHVDADVTVMPFKCDPDENFYFRTYGDIDELAGPILKVNPKGELERTFSIGNAGLPGIHAYDFNVAEDGGVSQLGWLVGSKTHETYWVKFRSDGTVGGKEKLAAGFVPTGPIATFPSGELLVSGFRVESDAETPRKAFTAIFAADGALIKEVIPREDQRIDAEFDERTKTESFRLPNTAISSSVAVTGSDGNVYLMRQTAPAIVYVINAKGDLVRTLKVRSGESDLPGVGIFERNGRLAILFRKLEDRETLIRVVDARTGDVYGTYVAGPELGSGMVCYGDLRFTFLSAKNKQIEFLRAEP